MTVPKILATGVISLLNHSSWVWVPPTKNLALYHLSLALRLIFYLFVYCMSVSNISRNIFSNCIRGGDFCHSIILINGAVLIFSRKNKEWFYFFLDNSCKCFLVQAHRLKIISSGYPLVCRSLCNNT